MPPLSRSPYLLLSKFIYQFLSLDPPPSSVSLPLLRNHRLALSLSLPLAISGSLRFSPSPSQSPPRSLSLSLSLSLLPVPSYSLRFSLSLFSYFVTLPSRSSRWSSHFRPLLPQNFFLTISFLSSLSSHLLSHLLSYLHVFRFILFRYIFFSQPLSFLISIFPSLSQSYFSLLIFLLSIPSLPRILFFFILISLSIFSAIPFDSILFCRCPLSLSSSLSLSIFLFPQFAPIPGQSLSSLIVLLVASSPPLHFIFLSFNLSESLLPSSLLIPISSPIISELSLHLSSSSLPIPHSLPTSLPHSSFSLSISYLAISLILRSQSNLFSSVNNPQSRLLFSFLSRLFSLFSTFLSSSHLIYLSILYFPRSIVNIFSFHFNLPLFTLSPHTHSRFCPFYSSILPLSLFISPKKFPL